MAEYVQRTVLHLNPAGEGQELLRRIRSELASPDDCTASSRSSFDGTTVLEIILYVSSSKLATTLAELIATWMKEKSKRTVKIDGNQFTGYSVSDIATILDSSRTHRGQKRES